MNKSYLISFLFVVAMFGLGYWLQPTLPAQLPSHWNIAGEVDAYASKDFVVFQIPTFVLCILILLMWLPTTDPKHENVKHNQPYYNQLVLMMTFFFFSLHAYTIAWAYGFRMNVGQFMSVLIGLLFVVIGAALNNIKQNWFFGIRTPWTISNEMIWEKTHKVAGNLFKAAGILVAGFSLYDPVKSFQIMMAMIIAIVTWSIVYPYILWKKIKKLD